MTSRPTVSLIDQVLANASNALVVLAVARSGTPEEFGIFAIAYAVLAFQVGLARSLLSAPISMAAEDGGRVERETGLAFGVLVGGAPVIFAVTLAPSMASTSAPTGMVLLALAAPFVLIQDTLRYSAVAQGRPVLALWSDLAWTVCSASVFVAGLVVGVSTSTVLGVWFAGAVLSCVLLAVSLGAGPARHGYRSWFRQTGSMRAGLSGGNAAMSASVPLSYWIFARSAGPSPVGAVGGAGQLMAPVNTLTAFLGLYALSHMAGSDPRTKFRLMTLAGGGLGVIAAGWGLVLIVIPSALGAALLGATWDATREILPLAAVQYAVGALAYAYTLLITSQGLARQVLFLGLAVAAVRIGAVTIAGAVSDSATTLVIAEVTTMAAWLVIALWIGYGDVRKRGRRLP